MGETRKYPRSGRRSLISTPEILAKSGENVLVCVPIPALEIIRQIVRNRGYWRTTYASSYSDDFYTLPGDTDFDTITGFLDLFLEATTKMDCNDLITELDDIGNAITALSLGGGCGCGAGGGGATSPADDPTDTGDITLSTGTPPSGYVDWAAYQVAKCDLATYIVQSLLDDLRWWQTVQIATMTLAGLTAGMVSILSAFTLTAILAGLLAVLAYEFTMLEDAEDQMITGFEDLVCAILSGETSAESQANFIAEMDAQMTAAITDPISEFLVIQLLTVWTDSEFFNLLYAPYEDYLMHSIPAGADCSACGLSCKNFQVYQGTWLGGDVFQGELVSGTYNIRVTYNATDADCANDCGPMEEISLDGLIGYTPYSATNDSFRFYSDAACPMTSTNADAYSSDTIPTFGVKYCVRHIFIFSATQFTATIGRHGYCF